SRLRHSRRGGGRRPAPCRTAPPGGGGGGCAGGGGGAAGGGGSGATRGRGGRGVGLALEQVFALQWRPQAGRLSTGPPANRKLSVPRPSVGPDPLPRTEGAHHGNARPRQGPRHGPRPDR